MPKLLTIIICTYNRNEILKHCLYSFLSQQADPNLYDILIVNNYYNKTSEEEIRKMCKSLHNCQMITEVKAGLSRARNAGMKFTKTPWVGYIDDDCKIPTDFISIALNIISTDTYKCFGGHINSWWMSTKPRWMSDDFGMKPILCEERKTLAKDEFIWGGNMFFKRALLQSINGFDESVGMNADHIGYSAENRVQMKLLEKKVKIGYDPNLVVDHLVAPYKYEINWHLKAAFAEGRDGRTIFPEQYNISFMLKEILRLPKSFIVSLFRWVSDDKYYWENLIIDNGKVVWKLLGKLKSKS